MRLVGIAGLDGEQRGRGFALLPLQAPVAMEAQNAVERLRAIAEGILETASQRPFAHMQLALQERNQRRFRRQTFMDHVEGPAHLRDERIAAFGAHADRLFQLPQHGRQIGHSLDAIRQFAGTRTP